MQVLLDVMLFGWIAVLQWWWGGAVARRVLRRPADDETATEPMFHNWLGCILGNGMLSLLVFALGIPHWVTRPVMFGALGVLSIPVVITLVGWLRKRTAASSPRVKPTATEALLLTIIVGVVVIALGGALSPEVRGDAIIYHITEAMLFSVNRGHVDIPGSALTYIPQNQQLLYALGLTLGSDALAKLFHWWAGVLLLWGTTIAACMLGVSRAGGFVAAVLVALFPIWTYLATSCYVDLATANYTLAAVLLLICAPAESSLLSRCALSGAMLGFAMGTKYTAIVNATAPAGVALLYYLWRAPLGPRHRATATFVFCKMALLLFLPWLGRNLLWTGNPLAPSLMRVLGPPGVPESTLNWPDIAAGDPTLLHSPLRLLSAYISMYFSFADYGNYLPVLLLIVVVLKLLLVRKALTRATQVVAVVFIFLIAAFLLGVPTMTIRRDSRYVMAHAALVSALLVLYSEQLIRHLQISAQRVRVLGAFFLLLLVGGYVYRTRNMFAELNESLIPPFESESRHRYLRERLADYDSNVVLSAAALPPTEKVYGAAYPARVHYVMGGSPLKSDLFVPPTEMLKATDLEKLRRQGVRYIFGKVPPELAPELKSRGPYGSKPLCEIP